jgi:hypothetical protein
MPYGFGDNARLPNREHERRPWRIREIVPDFTLEDVWALPVEGAAEDFDELLAMTSSLNPAEADSRATRFLWELRDRLGAWFGLGRIGVGADGGGDGGEKLPVPGTEELSLSERLPADLRGTATDHEFGRLPFVPLYRTETEAAAEISNRTVHGVAHFAWVEQDDGRYRGQLAVYVKPRGAFGHGYMALIKPFRYLIVYPALMRQFEAAWKRRHPGGGAQLAS